MLTIEQKQKINRGVQSAKNHLAFLNTHQKLGKNLDTAEKLMILELNTLFDSNIPQNCLQIARIRFYL